MTVYSENHSPLLGELATNKGVAAYRRESGNSLCFNGQNDYVDMGDPAILDAGTGAWSVECWVKIKTGPNAAQYLVYKGGDGITNAGYCIYLSGANSWFIISDGLGVSSPTSPNCGDLRTGAWIHLVGVIDRVNGKLRSYKNGIEMGSGGTDISTYTNSIDSARNFYVGRRHSTASAAYGLIDNVRVYARALSATEVKQHMGGVFADESNLVGCWILNEGTGNPADSSGQGNTGTISGADWVNQGVNSAPVGLKPSTISIGLSRFIKPLLGELSTISRSFSIKRIFLPLIGELPKRIKGFGIKFITLLGEFSRITRGINKRIFAMLGELVAERVGISKIFSTFLGELSTVSREINMFRLGNAAVGERLSIIRNFFIKRTFLVLKGASSVGSRRVSYFRLFASESQAFPYTFPFSFAGGLQITPSATRSRIVEYIRYPSPPLGKLPTLLRNIEIYRGSGISLTFQGVTLDRVDCGSNATLEAGTGSWSVELWAKVSASSAPYQYLIDKGGDSISRAGYSIYINETSGATVFAISDGLGVESYTSPSMGDIRNGEWHHIVGVIDRVAGRLRSYKDGVQVGTGSDISTYTNSITNAALALLIGGRNAQARSAYGLIDEVRIYARALSETEVKQHFSGVFSDETAVKGVWHFNEGTGSTTADSSGNGNTGTISGPTWSESGISSTKVGGLSTIGRAIKIRRILSVAVGKISSMSRVISVRRIFLLLEGLAVSAVGYQYRLGNKILTFSRGVYKIFFR